MVNLDLHNIILTDLQRLASEGVISVDVALINIQRDRGLSPAEMAEVHNFLSSPSGQLQQAVARFRTVDLSGDKAALLPLLPKTALLGEDALGNAVDPQEFRFGRVNPDLSPHGMLFTGEVRSYAEDVLGRALGDATFARFFRGSKNRAEEYLNMVAYLLPKSEAEAKVMPEQATYLIWEALGRVDADANGQAVELVVNRRLQGINLLAERYLGSVGLHRMAQLALAERDGRVKPAGLFGGNGALWNTAVSGLLESDDPLDRRLAKALYDALKPVFEEEGIALNDLLSLNPDADWLQVNGVDHSCPGIVLHQVLFERVLQSYGFRLSGFHLLSGQSQGEATAFAMADSFGKPVTPVLAPTFQHIAGLHSLQAMQNFMRWMIGEGKFFSESVPQGEGPDYLYTMTTSGIPFERAGDRSTLDRVMMLVNGYFQNGEHVFVSNVNTIGPSYYTLVAGTPKAMRILHEFIMGWKSKRPVDQYPVWMKPVLRDIGQNVIALLDTIADPSQVRDPMLSDVTGISFPPHDPLVLDTAYEEFLVEMGLKGVRMGPPTTAVIRNSDGQDARTVRGISMREVLARDNFLEPVSVPLLTQVARDSGSHVIVDFGPGNALAENFIARNDPAIPVIAGGTAAGFKILTSTDPGHLQRAITGAVTVQATVLADGTALTVKADGKVSERVQPGRSSVASFDEIPGLEVEREDLNHGTKIRLRVTVRAELSDANQAQFSKAFLSQGRGRVNMLFETSRFVDGRDNPLAKFTRARNGWSYEWIVEDGKIQELRIVERNRLVVLVSRQPEQKVQVSDFTYTHGRSELTREYLVDTTQGQVTDLNRDAAFRARARVAYAIDWRVNATPEARELLARRPSETFLQDWEFSYTYRVTASDMTAYARTTGSAAASVDSLSYLKDRVMGRGMLVPMLAEAFDLDPTQIRNIGGSERRGVPLKVGETVTVRSYVTGVEDVHFGPLQGRRLMAAIVATNEAGEVLAESRPSIISLGKNDLASGEIRPVFVPRSDLATEFDYFGGRRIYTPKKQNLAAAGEVRIPPNAPEIFVDDPQRFHVSDATAILAGAEDGRVMQGEVTFDRVNERVVRDLTRNDLGRYVGFANRQITAPVRPGDTLFYEAVRLRHGEGLHEYDVTVRNAAGDEVMTYTLYAKGPQRLIMWTGQGSLDSNNAAEVLSDPARAAHFARMQKLLQQAGYPIDLKAALEEATTDTAKAQVAQAAYVMPYYDQAVAQGLIPDDAIHTGLSLGMWLAMRAAGYLDDTKLMPGLGQRSAEMARLVDETMGMMVITKYKGSEEYLYRLCAQASTETELVVPGNVNTYTQTVVSGHKAAMTRLAALIATQELGETQLLGSVATPFHSPLLAQATRNMQAAFDEENPFAAPVRFPQRVIMDTTVQFLDPNDPQGIARQFADQISSTTRFAAVITRVLEEFRGREFVEMGARPTLTRMVYSIAKSLGINPDDLDIMFANPDVEPEDWARFTYDAVRPIALPQPVVKAVFAPSAPQQAGVPPTPSPAGIAATQERPVAAQAVEVVPVSVSDFRRTHIAASSQAIGRPVDATDPAKEGSTPLVKVLNQRAKQINVEGGAFASLLALFAKPYEDLGPGAIELLEGTVAYLRGILGLAAGVASPIWAHASEAEILEAIKILLTENAVAGDFKVIAENFVPEAELSEKGAKPLGINSKKLPGAIVMVQMLFGIAITKAEGEKLETLESLVRLIRAKVNDKVAVIPDTPTALRHMVMLELKAKEHALNTLTVAREKLRKAQTAASSGAAVVGGGVSEAQLAELKTEVKGEIEAAMQEAARKQLAAIARAAGIRFDEDTLRQVTITPTGELVPTDEVKAKDDAKRLAALEAAVSPEFADAMQPSFRPELEYSFGSVEQNGAMTMILRFVRDLRADQLNDPETLTERINVLANQVDHVRLSRIKWYRSQMHDADHVAAMDRLIARAERVVAYGPQFDGVIGLHGAVHVPVYGTYGTRVEDRGMSSSELIQHYQTIGIPDDSIQALRSLVNDGFDGRGRDVVVTGGGTIGEPLIADLLRLGFRVIVVDYKGRSSREADGSYRSDLYRRLRNENGVAGITDQLIVEPYFNQGNPGDLEKLFTHMVAKGYRPSAFFHTAAVSDYGPIEEPGRPYDMARVHGFFPRDFETRWAGYYRDNPAELKDGLPMLSERFPTPNNFNQLAGSGNYDVKEIARPGATARRLYNEGIRQANGDPVIIEDHHRTGATYPSSGLKPNQDGDKQRLMQQAALLQRGYEEGAQALGRPFYGFQGNEIAALSLATKVALWTHGPAAYHRDGRLPVLVREHDSTGGFRALEQALEGRGLTLEEFNARVKEGELARHRAQSPYAPRPATDPVHLPLDGSTNDLNDVLARVRITDDRRTEGRFTPRETDIFVSPSTMVTVGHGAVSAGGASTLGTYRYWLSLTQPELPSDLAWLGKMDVYDILRGTGVKAEDLRAMTTEAIEADHRQVLRDQVGAQRLPEAVNFKFLFPFEAPEDMVFRTQKSALAELVRGGHEILQDDTGAVFFKVKKGQRIYTEAVATLPANVIVNLPGGATAFNWATYGVGVHRSEDQGTQAYAQHMGKMASGQVLMTSGETAATLNTQVPRGRRHAALTLALADSNPFRRTIVGPMFADGLTGDEMAAELGDGWVGQEGSEQSNYTGMPLCIPGACSSGNVAQIVAGQMVAGAYHEVAKGEQDEGHQHQAWQVGGADYAATNFVLSAFVAARAVFTDEQAREGDIPIGRWSRADNRDVGGFVPGVGAGELLQMPYELALKLNQNFQSAIIGSAYATDGKDEGPREAYGIGLILAIFRAWRQAQTYIEGLTDREKLTNIRAVAQGHKTSTPLGDGFEAKVWKLFFKYAGINGERSFYDPTHPWYLGLGESVGSFEDLLDPDHSSYVGKLYPGLHYLDGLDRFLEERLSPDARARLGAPEGYVVYHAESKVPFGHTLGAHSALDAALRQPIFRFGIIPGNPAFENARPEAGSHPYLAHTNDSIRLANLGDDSKKPTVIFNLAAGFSHKNTAIIEAETVHAYKTEAEAIAATAARVRRWAVERAQLRAEREGKRLMVAHIDAQPYPYASYDDLRALHDHSQAIARHLIQEQKPLDFNNVMTWALLMPRDPDVTPIAEDLEIDAAVARLREVETAFDTADIERIHELAKEQSRAEQPILYVGGSEGMGMRTLMSDILSGAVKNAVLVHFDRKGREGYYNAPALRAWAASHGANLRVVNKNGVIFDSTSYTVPNGKLPQSMDEVPWDTLRFSPFDPEIIRAIQEVQAVSPSGDFIVKNFIAFGAPERLPGMGKIIVPSIDAQGRGFFETVEDVDSWEQSVERTIGPMGFNHWAIIEICRALGMIGPRSIVLQMDWKNGKTQGVLGGVYYDGGALGPSKDIARFAVERARALYQAMGQGFYEVVAYPFFFSLASRLIPGAWQYGLQSRRILEERGQYMTMEKLATQATIRVLGNRERQMMNEVDQAEYAAIPATAENAARVTAAMGRYYWEHADRLVSDPTDPKKIRYIPAKDFAQILGDTVPQNYLDILAVYLPPELKAAREKAAREVKGQVAVMVRGNGGGIGAQTGSVAAVGIGTTTAPTVDVFLPVGPKASLERVATSSQQEADAMRGRAESTASDGSAALKIKTDAAERAETGTPLEIVAISRPRPQVAANINGIFLSKADRPAPLDPAWQEIEAEEKAQRKAPASPFELSLLIGAGMSVLGTSAFLSNGALSGGVAAFVMR